MATTGRRASNKVLRIQFPEPLKNAVTRVVQVVSSPAGIVTSNLVLLGNELVRVTVRKADQGCHDE